MKYCFCKNKPNLSIFLPVGCNANCDFCYSNNKDFCEESFYNGLINTLEEYKTLTKISITGGEPTLNADVLLKTLKIIRKYNNIEKVVLTSNGYNIGNKEIDSIINEYVDRLNVSRHSYDDLENEEIFKTDILFDLKNIKIRVNMNAVIEFFPDEESFEKYISYAKEKGFESITFRKKFDVNDFILPEYLDKYKIKEAYSCNGKITFIWFIKDEFKINLSTGNEEPCNICSKFNTEYVNFVYELILDNNGILRYKWKDGIVIDKIIQPNYKKYCMSFSKNNKFEKFKDFN